MVNNNLSSAARIACKKTILSGLIILCGLPVSAQVKKGKRPETDTFKIANQFIAKKKFRKADKVLKKYHAAHPKDLNAVWLRAQTNLYASNFSKSDKLYQDAIKLAPTNDYLTLNYIHSLADMGKTTEAEKRLYDMENKGTDYSDISLLHSRLYYYQGDNKRAAAYMKKALQYNNQNPEALDLNDQIEMARAPKVSLNAAFLSDNQPLQVFFSSVKAEKSFSKAVSLFVEGGNNQFLQNTTSNAPWVKAGNRMFFPKAGLHINYGAGVMKFPVKNETTWTGELNINEKISQQFDVDVTVDRVPYFGTKASVDTNITATRFAAMLNWHKRNWMGQAAFLNSTFRDNNNVYSAYAWLMAPLVQFPTGKFQMGLSTSYTNSNDNRFLATKTVSEVLSNYTAGANIPGIFNPYFTPRDLYISSVLMAFNVSASKQVDINLSGDVGYGSILNPYFYLNKTSAGSVYMAKDYSTETFTPFSASFGLNYHISKTWLLTTKYTYRSTYFFNSNYVTAGLEKSFQHGKKSKQGNGKKSAYSKAIMDIEDKIQALYRCKNANDLKLSVGNIKNQLVALRDAQLKRKSMTEVTPGSELAATLQERLSNLNDMIAEIDGVNLEDKEKGSNKREWMVDKQFELSNIHYNGNLDEE